MQYIPEQGDIVLIDFNPQIGHEQKGKRPALVISNNIYNNFTRMAVVCPITNTNKGFPLHIELDDSTITTGVIMCEQFKALDIIARNAAFLEKVPKHLLEEVLDVIEGIFEIQ